VRIGDSNISINNVVKTHKSNLIDYLRFKMRISKEDAEEIVMDTFLKMNSTISTFNSKYLFTTWLYRIAINTAIDFYRRKKFIVNRVYSDDFEPYQNTFLTHHDITYDQNEIDKITHKAIRNAIHSLPPKYRDIFVLRYFCYWSYKDIAEFKNVTINSVKCLVFRGKLLLKPKLKYVRDINYT